NSHSGRAKGGNDDRLDRATSVSAASGRHPPPKRGPARGYLKQTRHNPSSKDGAATAVDVLGAGPTEGRAGMAPEIRKIVVTTEEIYLEGQGRLAHPLRVAAAMAVVKNPFAGSYAKDIGVLSGEYSAALGPKLAKLAADALGSTPKVFGK